MKLLILAALIAVSSGGRLQHLDRSYLPPDGSGETVTTGSGTGNIAGSQNSAFTGSASQQYLTPNQPTTGSTSNVFNSQSSVPNTSSGVSQFGSSFSSPNGSPFNNAGVPSGSSFSSPSDAQESRNYESQGVISRQYLGPAVLSQNSRKQPLEQKSSSSLDSTNGFGSASGSSFGSSIRNSKAPSSSPFDSISVDQKSGKHGSQGATSQQYSAPESSFQNSRQQFFDQKSASPSLDPNNFRSGSSSSSGTTFSNFGSPSGSSFGYPSSAQESGNCGSQGTISHQDLASSVASQNSRLQPFKENLVDSFRSSNGFRSASGSPVSNRNSGYSYSYPDGAHSVGNDDSQGAISRQYSAPELSSRNNRQQLFDQKPEPGSNDFGSTSSFSSDSAIRISGTPSSSSISSQSGAQINESQGATSRQYQSPAAPSQRSPQQSFDQKSGYIY